MSAETPNAAGSKTWIMLPSGKPFEYTRLESNGHLITDIAACLSKKCRFGGACEPFYSVAQHSVIVSTIVPPEDALAALFHDVGEYPAVDMMTPLKRLFPGYKAFEEQIRCSVFRAYGIAEELPESVHRADEIALATEGKFLFPNGWPYETLNEKPLESLTALDPAPAKVLFLKRAAVLLDAHTRRAA